MHIDRSACPGVSLPASTAASGKPPSERAKRRPVVVFGLSSLLLVGAAAVAGSLNPLGLVGAARDAATAVMAQVQGAVASVPVVAADGVTSSQASGAGLGAQSTDRLQGALLSGFATAAAAFDMPTPAGNAMTQGARRVVRPAALDCFAGGATSRGGVEPGATTDPCGLPATVSVVPVMLATTASGDTAAAGAAPIAASTSTGTNGAFAIAPAAVSASPLASVPVVQSGHPRLILNAATLATLRARAAANTPEWLALKQVCDSFIGGTVNYPTGDAYMNLPNLGSGYEGESYLPALLSEGICYQVLKTSNPTAAANYGAKAVDILMKMSAPYQPGSSSNQGWDPNHDSGYPMRNYGVGFGLGYDWVYDLLTPAQRTQIYTTANAWIQSFETQTFEYDHPQSNYFAGYFHAKAVIALGTYGDNPQAPTEWQDWYTNQFGQRVQPYYARHLVGGGWPEGFANYAPLGILNMTLPAREVMTATGTDIIHPAAAPYSYPLDNANYLMHFTWPSRAYFDDRDMNHSENNPSPTLPPPGTTQVGLAQLVLGELGYWQSPQVAVFHQYVNEINAATRGYNAAVPWVAFLETNSGAPTASLSTLPLSYFAQGMNAVAARSDWGTGATWMSFRAGPYVNSPAQGEEYFDQGGLALVRGGSPLLVNPTGWIVHEPNGGADEDRVYNDNQGKSDGTPYMGNRQIYNLYFARKLDASGNIVGDYGQRAFSIESYPNTRTQVSAYEDAGSYVYVLATHLEDMFSVSVSPKAVASWSRSVLYLRPNRFVVFDRTQKGDVGYDQYEAWHFPSNPATGTAASGQRRIDVTYNGTYMGAMTTVLPANATLTTIPMYPTSNPVKVWQVQVRPADTGVRQNWLTVFDLSASAAAVAKEAPITVTQGAMVGVQLSASDGNAVVLESTNDPSSPVAGTISYVVPASQAHHVLVGLPAGAGYDINASVNGNNLAVTVSPGGSFVSSVSGVLDFSLSAGGTVGVGVPSAPPLPPPVSTMPVPGFPVPYKP